MPNRYSKTQLYFLKSSNDLISDCGRYNMLDMYKGYFIDDDKNKVFYDELTNKQIVEYVENGNDYIVPLTVAKVDKFELYDKVIIGNDIRVIDDENVLTKINYSPKEYWLVVIDEEHSYNIDIVKNKISKIKTEDLLGSNVQQVVTNTQFIYTLVGYEGEFDNNRYFMAKNIETGSHCVISEEVLFPIAKI